MTVFVKRAEASNVRFPNDTGSDLAQYEFAVVGPYAAVADEAITAAATGSLYVQEGIQIETDDLVTGEDTFDTEGQEVYWDATGQEFSDTETAGYYLVGYLIEAKDSDRVIVFEKLRYAELITS